MVVGDRNCAFYVAQCKQAAMLYASFVIYLLLFFSLYTVSPKKTRHHTIVRNFAKC